ncbi:MAG: TRAP transporter substrate-binding protein DctP, partial [Gammaproteobacteria bacterium]|nr:TRAP transporter substrate-binding protein DctP [Gammaproteobacteria bacterium]
TAWMKEIDRWMDEVYEKSNGRLKFKIYPGGVMGDEPDVLRKIRKNQLQGGLFTGYGIGRIYSPARVLEMPFLFKNTNESDYVRDQLMPEIEAGFKQNGFELLGWPEVGFIHFFSKNKIESIEDMKKSRIWLWQGDPLGEAFFKAADISPVPLSIIDVYPQLSARHGGIDTVYISTFGAIGLQWHTKLKYGTNIAVTNAIGGLVISNRFFDKLPDDLQQLLKTTGKIMSDKVRKNARFENTRSRNLLERYGIKFLWDWNDSDMKEFLQIRDEAARHLEDSNYIPADFSNRARSLLEQYRSTQTKKP